MVYKPPILPTSLTYSSLSTPPYMAIAYLQTVFSFANLSFVSSILRPQITKLEKVEEVFFLLYNPLDI